MVIEGKTVYGYVFTLFIFFSYLRNLFSALCRICAQDCEWHMKIHVDQYLNAYPYRL